MAGKNGIKPSKFKRAQFKIVPTTKIIEPSMEALAGAEVEVKADVSMGTYILLKELIASEHSDQVAQAFGDEILSAWNLTDEGDKPIPATGAGMNLLPASMAMGIITDWLGSLDTVPDPLVSESRNGALSEAELLEMGESSRSLVNSSGLD